MPFVKKTKKVEHTSTLKVPFAKRADLVEQQHSVQKPNLISQIDFLEEEIGSILNKVYTIKTAIYGPEPASELKKKGETIPERLRGVESNLSEIGKVLSAIQEYL